MAELAPEDLAAEGHPAGLAVGAEEGSVGCVETDAARVEGGRALVAADEAATYEENQDVLRQKMLKINGRGHIPLNRLFINKNYYVIRIRVRLL